MAQLRQAEDDHYYILAGPSKGTWQISDEGLDWLREDGFPTPRKWEITNINAGTYRTLERKKFLHLRDDVPQTRSSTSISIATSADTLVTDFPLLLEIRKQEPTSWVLKIELSGLSDVETTWTAIQHPQVARITMNASRSFLLPRQLLNVSCLLEVQPESRPYLVLWENAYGDRSALPEVPITPGLLENSQGNVFVESRQITGLWRRYLPGSTPSFTGPIHWLAKIGRDHEWPGKAQIIGTPHESWVLWRLDALENSPVEWKAIEQWFSEREIDITNQHQHLQLLSPPEYINESEYATFKPGVPLLFQCTPPRRSIRGAIQESYLTATAFHTNETHLDRTSQTRSSPFTTDETGFFSWQPPRPGQYRIRLSGDTLSEPLIVRVNAATVLPPQWLHGFSCTVASENLMQTFCAFQDTPVENEADAKHMLDQFTPQQLETLTWTIKPDNLPVRVSWKATIVRETRQGDYSHIIRSNAELTMHWQEHIWSKIADCTNIHLTLDAGSFGLIEVTIIPANEQQEDEAWWENGQLCTQFVWLSRVIEDKAVSPRTVLPATLRHSIRQASRQVQNLPILYRALARLTSAEEVPVWIIIRLQALLKEVAQ